MKHNLISYIKTFGELSFGEKSFCPEDAMALTVLSYLKMDKLVPGLGKKEAVEIQKLAKDPDAEKMFSDPIYGKAHKEVFLLMAQSRRFRMIKLNHFIEWSDGAEEMQFSAVTFFLGEKSVVIAFRGTDETLNGWKENFNMGFLPSIPSQRKALAYLMHTADCTKGKIIVTGHSKGGNLALYAASFAPVSLQHRICRIFNFDGPGMQQESKKISGYNYIKDKYCKIVPEESIIGMLFQYDADYRVVRSCRRGLMQHDVLQWIIIEGRFAYVTDLRKKYGYLSHVLNNWIRSLSKDQISSFVEVLYQMVCASQVKTVYELLSRPVHTWFTFHAEYFHLDHIQKKAFTSVIYKFLKILVSSNLDNFRFIDK